MAVTKIKPVKSTLSKALDYIQNPDKTDGKMLVSSFGCSYETADIEFEYTLSQALQKGNNLAFHLIQSFEPGEVDYETAHKIGKQLASVKIFFKSSGKTGQKNSSLVYSRCFRFCLFFFFKSVYPFSP